LRIAERRISTQAAYFSVDVFFCEILALFLPGIYAPLLLSICMFFDFVSGIVSTYYFRPQDIPYVTRSLFLLPFDRLARYGIVALLMVTLLGTINYLLRKAVNRRMRYKTARVLFLVTLILVSIDVWNRYRIYRDPDTVRMVLLRFPEMTLAKRWLFAVKQPSSGHGLAEQYSDSASERGLALLGNLSSRPDIVEILVESWGDDQGTITTKLEENYRTSAIARRYDVVTGTVPFWGPTVSGEVRELCHSTFGLNILHRNVQPPENCIPSVLAKKGYSTEAVHGYFGKMFDRSRWYPLIGFEKMSFKDALHKQGLSDCTGRYAFPGVCDRQISTWIGNQLAQAKGLEFIYWVTLNSHLPVPPTANGLNPAPCNFDSQVSNEQSLCSWFKLEYEVHQSIADMVERPDLPPTAFFVVGDHAPPFVDTGIRDRFSNSRVPFVLLIPKQVIKKQG